MSEFNLSAALTAATFASTDKTRAVLTGVLMVGEKFFVATDSYWLGMVTTENLNAQDIVAVLKANGDVGPSRIIPGELIAAAGKLRPTKKSVPYEVDLSLDGPTATFTVTSADGVKSVNGRLIEGDYPRIGSLVNGNVPGPVKDFGVNTDQLARLDKATVLLGGNHQAVFHGGVDNMKPAYWSFHGDHGSCVVLQMPIRDAGCWS